MQAFTVKVFAGFLLLLAFPFLARPAEARGPFAPLAGTWVGGGTIELPGGASERLRCRASYVVSPGGDALTQSLRCASQSYQVIINSEVEEQGGAVSGRWEELTRGASGTLSGVVRGGTIQGTIAGTGFTAALSLVTRGRTQTVSIRLQGPEIAGVTAAFRKL
ncbi:MAG TPA: hypothetical protein VKV77_10715 [Methylovirgula sp.]|nr:hypothetical protein [Methylovirgula sp.]